MYKISRQYTSVKHAALLRVNYQQNEVHFIYKNAQLTWNFWKRKRVSKIIFCSCWNHLFSSFIRNISFYKGIFFYLVFLMTIIHGTGKEERGYLFFSSLLLPPVHDNSNIYTQLFIWDDYRVFLFAVHVITSLLIDETYPQLGICIWLKVNCNLS